MKTIIHIQHCESVHHTNGMIGSSTDWELSLNGIKQAHNIGKKLHKELNDDFVIISSNLKRAQMTADIVGEHLNAKVLFDERLRERHLGVACGKTSAWAKANSKPYERNVDFIPWDESESVRDHYKRVKSFFDDLLLREETHIILVSHGGTKSVFNTMFLNIDVDQMIHVNIHSGAGSISKYFIDDDGFRRVRSFGDTYYKMD